LPFSNPVKSVVVVFIPFSSQPQLTDTALLWTQSSTAVQRRYCFVFHSHAINPLELVYMLRLCAYENEAAHDGQLAHTELSDEELTLLLQFRSQLASALVLEIDQCIFVIAGIVL
jgi:hypothetical protein